MNTHSTCYNSPLGQIRISENGQSITAIKFVDAHPTQPETDETETPLLREAVRQLSEYFGGKRQHFDLPLDQPGTGFQKRIWRALCTIPCGETRTYGQIAVAVGCPKGARAVGMACNRNAITIAVPCHRVIGANGKLTGYAGGLERKRQLLAIERR
ncbi:MAG: methylated-DNA--[protein]-cysteine S-methyltransferase [Tannerella sp.]|nr:methylated-DNA--[protein]-cysteine S-methyltransferase [Tannerella sp.]